MLRSARAGCVNPKHQPEVSVRTFFLKFSRRSFVRAMNCVHLVKDGSAKLNTEVILRGGYYYVPLVQIQRKGRGGADV